MTFPGARQLDPYAAVAAWVAACPKLSLSDYVRSCFGHKNAALPAAPYDQNDEPISAKDLVSILCAIGLFEPRGATEPRACDVVTPFDKTVEVPPATEVDGVVTPSEEKLLKICAPQHRSLVVDTLRGLPANLTAAESGMVFSRAMQVHGFSEAFCPPGEPGDGQDPGAFANIEHVVLCPGSGFDLFARNFDPTSPALFHVSAVIWSTC